MRVGIGRAKITPEDSVYLCGHAIRTDKSSGILDDLFCTALVLESQNESICLLNYDLIMIDEYLSNRIRKAISELINTPTKNVFTIVTHTHSGPEIDDNSVFGLGKNRVQPGYRDRIFNESISSVKLAMESLGKTTLSFKKINIDSFYGNRNNIEYPSDKSFNVINFIDSDNRLLCGLINLSCHPTVLGPQNHLISADLFGAIRKRFENKFKVPFVITNGAQGDVSNRQYRLGNDSDELERVATGIYEQTKNISNFKEIKVDSIKVREHIFKFESELDHERYRKEIEETMVKLEDKYLPFDQRKVLSSGIAVLQEKLKIKEKKQIEFVTYVIELGDLRIVTIPGELFSKFALEIKSKIKNEILIFGLTNYSNGYLIEENEYGKNYESMTTMIPKGTIEKYIEDLITYINN